jgi:hypothetical protein
MRSMVDCILPLMRQNRSIPTITITSRIVQESVFSIPNSKNQTEAKMTRTFFLMVLTILLRNVSGQPPTEANLRAAALTGGTIKFSSDGTITLNELLTVDRDLVIDGDGHTVTLDGQSRTALIKISRGVRLSLKDLTLANGSATVAFPQEGGGALNSDGGILTIDNCVFTNNTAVSLSPTYTTASGGAIVQYDGSIVLHGGAFVNNVVRNPKGTARGGAIFAFRSDISVQGAAFRTNKVAGANSDGGAISLFAGRFTADRSIFANNSSGGEFNGNTVGGAISSTEPNGSTWVFVSLTNCTFLYNEAIVTRDSLARGFADPGPLAWGGALGFSDFSQATILGCSFVGNIAKGGPGISVDNIGWGGAIFVGGLLRIANSTFYANSASRWDGTHKNTLQVIQPAVSTIYTSGATYATNLTLVNNSSTGSTISSDVDNGERITLKNSLIGKNIAPAADYGITDGGYNLTAGASPAFTARTSRENVDVNVGELGDFGGPTPSVPLLAGSPAIDAGDDSAAPLTDQRGRSRFGGRSDIGAFESSPPFTIHGRLTGYVNRTAFVTLEGVTQQPDSDGFFRFFVPPGQHTVEFTGPEDLIFREKSITVNVAADVLVSSRVFRASTLAYDPDLPAPAFTFASNTPASWRFDVSNDLRQWTPVQTNQFTSAGLFSIPLSVFAPPIFLRAVQQ